jgi:hypothetical protein
MTDTSCRLCSTRARQGDDRCSTEAVLSRVAVKAAMPTETASASSVLRPCPVDSTRTRARVWRARPQPSAVSRWVSGAPSPAAPIHGPARDWSSGGRRSARQPSRLTGTRMMSSGCSDASTAAAVPRCLVRIDRDHDAVGGWCFSHGVVLLLRSTGMSSGRAQQLSASQASLQPLPADGAGPGHKPSKSQPGGRQV